MSRVVVEDWLRVSYYMINPSIIKIKLWSYERLLSQITSNKFLLLFLFFSFCLTSRKLLLPPFLSLFINFYFILFFSYLLYQPQFYSMISVQYKVVELSNIMHADWIIRTCVASMLGFFFSFFKIYLDLVYVQCI